MKRSIVPLLLLGLCFASCSSSIFKKIANTTYTTSRDEGHEGNAKILKGIINRQILETDTAFNWFKDNMKYGQPDANAVNSFAKNKDKFAIIVFGGSWCHDTQNLLPTFYKLIDKSGFPADKVYLIGVDRAKTTILNLHKKYNITNVPTFIVTDLLGKELGRVVEYGKTGTPDKELGEIVSKIQ
jgi:thiol-disulfide isomerase/thioredoxin